MLITCEKCGLKYKVNFDKIKGETAQLRCKGCSEVITINKKELSEEKPAPETSGSLESTAETTPEDTAAAKEKATAAVGQIKKRPGIGLTAKVIVMMLIVSLIPGLAYFGISFYQTSKHITEEASNSTIQIANILTDEINEWADKNIRELNTLAKLPSMVSMDKAQQEAVLKVVQKEYPWMYLVFTMDSKGMNIARSDDTALTDYSSRQYVHDIQSGKDLAWENLIGKTSHKPALVVAVPIKNNNGQVVGIVASAMTLDAITRIVGSWQRGQTGQVFIVDQNGKVIAHPNEKFIQEQKDLSKNPLVLAADTKATALTEFKDDNGKERIGFSAKTQLNWVLAVQQEKQEAFAALDKAQTTAMTLFGMTVICIIIIAYFAGKAIVTPIRQLTDAANRISVGELSFEIGQEFRDEIGELADAITRMQDSIRMSIERLKRQRK
jgi:methyl-accepting chemotaxis protein